MGSLEDQAKELAAQRQREREAEEHKRQEYARKKAEEARRVQALAREFVALAKKYGVAPMRLYKDAKGLYLERQGVDYICEVWVVRSYQMGCEGLDSTPGLAVNYEGETIAYSDQGGFLALYGGGSPFSTLYEETIKEAAAAIVGGEPIRP
jgi:hypothetical protein